MNKEITFKLGVQDTKTSNKFDDEDGIIIGKSFTFKLLPNFSLEYDLKKADGKGYKFANTKLLIYRLEWLFWSIYYVKKSKAI